MIKQWELDAYNFKPLGPGQLAALIDDNDAIVKYLRSTCVRALSSTQPERSVERGDLLALDLNLLAGSLDDDKIQKYQDRIIKGEQNISIAEAKSFGFMICNPDTLEVNNTELLKAFSLKEGIKYYLEFYNSLPQIESSKDLPKLSEVSFVKDAQGNLIGEFSKNEVNSSLQVVKRNRRRLAKGPIPELVKKALVSVEDSRFWNFKPKASEDYEGHLGVDFKGLMRAMVSSGNGDLQGGSTITMQLAKNLLLYEDVFNEHDQGKRSLIRKLKEYILVRRIEEALTKDEILDWYLNTIDFGRSSQGIVMAAKSYFGKELKNLSVADVAFLAALPKAPNSLDPEENFEDALKRRNKVINSMKIEQYITSEEKKTARDETINFIPRAQESSDQGYASFYISAVERQLKDWLKFNEQDQSLAFDIVAPINHQYQKWAVESLQRGLLDIERSKGTLTVKPDKDNLPNIEDAVIKLAAEKNEEDLDKVYPEVLQTLSNPYPDGGQFKLAVVLSSSRFGLKDGTVVRRSSYDENRKKIIDGRKTSLAKWDVVLLQPIVDDGKTSYRVASYTEVQGSIVVIDNASGAVVATSGGFSIGAGRRFQGAAGNRAFNSKRQPGSTVKPFSYFSALMNGLSPATVVSNQNLRLPQRKIGGDKICDTWSLSSRQAEASSYTLRQGLEKSKNRLTVNAFVRALGFRSNENLADFADALGDGIDVVLGRMKKFGLYKEVEHACYPILLGANELTVVDLAGAYSTIANEGVYKAPHVLKSVSRNDASFNPFEQSQVASALLANGSANSAEEKFNLFRIRTFLQGVVKRGTARRMSDWYKVIAGKTGTTNNNKDAWFAGFNKEITVVVWVGYPQGKSLGSKYEGGVAALPIFKDFMTNYYESDPEKLKDEFSLKPNQGGVTAIIEPSTGFYITAEFQADFEHYTGRKSKLSGVEEYFRDNNELNNSVSYYRAGSEAAGRFFFENLSSDFKSYYRNEYNVKKQQVEASLLYDKQSFKAQDDYCRANKRQFPNHEYVINACAEAEYLKGYIRSVENSVGTLENYYIQTLGFY